MMIISHQYSDSIWRYLQTCAGKKHVLAAASRKSGERELVHLCGGYISKFFYSAFRSAVSPFFESELKKLFGYSANSLWVKYGRFE
jgi:hypothetical protein